MTPNIRACRWFTSGTSGFFYHWIKLTATILLKYSWKLRFYHNRLYRACCRLNHHDITELLLKVMLNTINLACCCMVSNSSFWLILWSGLGTLRLFLIFTQQSEMKRSCNCFLRVKVECKFSLIIGLAILVNKFKKS